MQQIGPYEIQEELGRGGMGVVYRGLDPVIGRTVAVKTLHASDLGDANEQERLRERLFREAKSAGILSHPGIVTIYQAGQDKDVLFIGMEFIDGPNLANALARTKPSLELTIDLVRQAAEALDYAHSKGVVHRDVKPANLLLQSDGRIKIADFGIAKLAAASLTKTGTTVGSPAYMSPEQIRAAPVDGRADQYSLAIMAYEMLTGLRPYDSDTISSLVFKIVFEQPDLASLATVPGGPALEQVFRKALSKSAEDRYPTCLAFCQALAAAAQGSKQAEFIQTLPLPSLMEPTPLIKAAADTQAAPFVPPPAVRNKRSSLPAAAAVIGGLIIGIGLWMALHREQVADTTKQTATKEVEPPIPPGTDSNEKATQPVVIEQVKPEYTPEALKAGIEGAVKLRIGINEKGQVEEADVVGPLDPGLDQKAIDAVKKWKFKPGMLRGKPVAMRSRVELEFHIAK